MATIEEIRQHVADNFFRTNPNPAVNGVAIGSLPAEGAAARENPRLGPESVLIFINSSAAQCEVNAIKQEFQKILEQNKSQATCKILHARMPVALTKTGTSLAPSIPSEYNVPPICAGTFGALVKAGGKSYLLSSNHVVVQNGRVQDQIQVVMPGAIDDPNGGQILGFRSYFVRLDPLGWGSTGSPANEVDCALAEVNPNVPTAAAITVSNNSLTVFSGTALPGTSVSKTGRTTGVTNSQIKIFNWEGPIAFSFGTYFFKSLTGTYDAHDPVTHNINVFASPGDSGSLVVDGSGKGIGLITARQLIYDSNDNFMAYIILFCSLDLVAQKLAGVMTGQLQFFV